MIEQNSINSYTNDLIIAILEKVAAHSFKDLINAKLCCRKWNELADDCNVYKHISLPWFFERKISVSEEYKRKLNVLFHKCLDAGNHDAWYIKGMFDYLEGKERGYAMECLKKAANAGHTGARYLICIISIFWGDEEDWKIGTDCLKTMMKSNEVRKKSTKIRTQIILAFTKTRMYNLRTVRPHSCCTLSDHMDAVVLNDNNEVECVSCRCDSDISYIYDIIYMCKSIRSLSVDFGID